MRPLLVARPADDRCTLGEVADELDGTQLRPPVMVIVGEVASQAAARYWFTRGRCSGRACWSRGRREQATQLARPLEELGAEVLVQPAIEIAPPDDWSPVDAALGRGWTEFDWLVFSSANGVRCLLERLLATGGDMRRLGGVKLAAIGPGTAEELAQLSPAGRPGARRVPGRVAGRRAGRAGARGPRFLLARASRGREVLAEELRAAGRRRRAGRGLREPRRRPRPMPEIAARLAAGKIDWITVTSSAIARSLATLFGEKLQQAKLVEHQPDHLGHAARTGLPAGRGSEGVHDGRAWSRRFCENRVRSCVIV